MGSPLSGKDAGTQLWEDPLMWPYTIDELVFINQGC